MKWLRIFSLRGFFGCLGFLVWRGLSPIFNVARKIRGRWFNLAARYPVLASVHYCIFDRSFGREMCAALSGRLMFLNSPDMSCGAPKNFALRRNVHRLEKGLIMRPRRGEFATDYILETVQMYEALQEQLNRSCNGGVLQKEDPLDRWAYDVLSEYFTVCRGHPEIEKARTIFERLRCPSQNGRRASPFCPSPLDPGAMNIEALTSLAMHRRSVRWYLPKPVDRKIIDRAIEVARFSPSACNRQPFEFRIFDDPEMVRKIGSVPLGVVGFSHNFPCFVVLVGRLRAYPNEYDRHLIYIDASLATMAFVLALEAQGIGTCCINWPDRADTDAIMGELLALAPDERVVMCISLGYPDPEGMVPFSQKKSIDQIRNFNHAPGYIQDVMVGSMS